MSLRSARLSAMVLLLSAFSCRKEATAPPDPAGAYRVLFVGNSLTYANDLPGMVFTLAEAAGGVDGRPVVTSSVTFGGYSLEDHWFDGRALAAIRGARWDLVVLQQGPSALASSRELLIRYAFRFDTLTRAAGGRTALYGVWPSTDRFFDFNRVTESYRMAADSVHGVFFPGGESWRIAWQRDATLPLYTEDGLHPTALGTYLVALVMVEQITGHPAVGLPGTVGAVSLNDALAHDLQLAATAANTAFRLP